MKHAAHGPDADYPGALCLETCVVLDVADLVDEAYEHEQAHYILVNAISPDGAADLDNGGEMGERCQRLEGE